ncbi:glycosyltransferase [Veillonella seminalis]|uniref:Glycosyltransferase 2-like domain-containing protein n=1 Tax=Veillonella seminalis ACS-216-V-Col6b TaxID=883156 RepID=K9D532_9FIRM|nr:glycosyltransferase [Veillonella seminalis]EKU79333.1 hypothetical protein HMPREF9282_00141 [Veillonella seminalis ACS-216-V-Col6b]
MQNIKISIIVPVYNNEKTIAITLESLIAQSLNEIEIICINDASTDNSLSIVENYAAKDIRVKVFTHERNCGTLKARKTGVLNSQGEYVMFLDGDDEYYNDSCQIAYETIKNKSVDMVHFNTDVINCSGVSNERIENNRKWLSSFSGIYQGDIVKACFEQHKFGANLLNKIYNGDICRLAFSKIENSKLTKGEDWYAFFIVAYYSKSYFGIDNILYKYNFGLGGTGSELTIDKYLILLTEVDTYGAFKRFILNKKNCKQYQKLLENIKYHFLDECIFKWYNELILRDKSVGFSYLLEFWGHDEVISRLSKLFWNNYYEIAEYIKESKAIKINISDRKTRVNIAFYYRSISGGGAQRVVALLCNLFANRKNTNGDYLYKVILITDDGPQRDEYELDSKVIREYLPAYISANRDYKLRFQRWQEIIEKNRLDIVANSLWVEPCTFWDALAVKSNDLRPAYIIHSHNFCAVPFQFANNESQNLLAKYYISDGVVTLSEVDQKFVSAFNKNAKYILNPIAFNPETIPASKYVNDTIVWVGRISWEKKPVDVIKMLSILTVNKPNVKLFIVGDGDKNILAQMKALVKSYNLEKSVFFEGFQLDVAKYYSIAKAFICTSEFEGFSLTISEALSHNVPVVTYDMPWLTFFKDGRGIVTVPQNRFDLLAKEVELLLNDTEKVISIGNLGKQQITEIASADIVDEWEKLFSDIFSEDNNNIDSQEDYNKSILYKHLTLLQLEGRNREVQLVNTRIINNNNLIKQEIENIDFEIKSIQDSLSFKLGRIITWIPRKIRGGIQCYKDHGGIYTIKRTMEHMGIDMKTGDFGR